MALKLTREAQNDLLSIARYTKRQWGKQQCAIYIGALDKSFCLLSENPLIGRPRDDLKKGYRCYPEGSHIIYYRVKNNDVEILSTLHKSMDVVEL